ncbi:hypothetical protein CA603_28425 [Paraburkholderia hospita]|nr:hypothetical protein CA603_28425 [Paraburkholderia hospita]
MAGVSGCAAILPELSSKLLQASCIAQRDMIARDLRYVRHRGKFGASPRRVARNRSASAELF